MADSPAVNRLLANQTYLLGDRIVNVLPHGLAPIAIRGTVVGLNDAYLEVVFDHSFLEAESLNGRCSQNRGLWIKKEAVLNLSNQSI